MPWSFLLFRTSLHVSQMFTRLICVCVSSCLFGALLDLVSHETFLEKKKKSANVVVMVITKAWVNVLIDKYNQHFKKVK